MRVARHGATLAVLVLAWGSSSCAPAGFAPESLLTSVRVLAASADKPYARPGDVVNVQVLAFDGRTADLRAANPMGVTWLPFVCKNPTNDAYYNCFTQPNLRMVPGGGAGNVDGGGDDGAVGAGDAAPGDAAPGDAGAEDGGVDEAGAGSADAGGGADGGAGDDGGGACSTLAADAGLAAPVVAGFHFTVPSNAVSSHPVIPGVGAPYGLDILFNVACAGQVAIVPLMNNGNPQQVPVACLDSAGKAQGPDGYVFGFTRVYAYEPDAGLSNANPIVKGINAAGLPLCFQGSSPSYVTGVVDATLCAPGNKSCPHVNLEPIVPPASQEFDPQASQRETVWVDFYSTFGGFSTASRLLYDPIAGALPKMDTDFEPPIVNPGDPRDGYVFAVVHDSRGGATWITIPVHLQ